MSPLEHDQKRKEKKKKREIEGKESSLIVKK